MRKKSDRFAPERAPARTRNSLRRDDRLRAFSFRFRRRAQAREDNEADDADCTEDDKTKQEQESGRGQSDDRRNREHAQSAKGSKRMVQHGQTPMILAPAAGQRYLCGAEAPTMASTRGISMADEQSLQNSSLQTPRTPQAQRALDEAAARRRVAASPPVATREINGRSGPEPVRYGDWENKGIASDF